MLEDFPDITLLILSGSCTGTESYADVIQSLFLSKQSLLSSISAVMNLFQSYLIISRYFLFFILILNLNVIKDKPVNAYVYILFDFCDRGHKK